MSKPVNFGTWEGVKKPTGLRRITDACVKSQVWLLLICRAHLSLSDYSLLVGGLHLTQLARMMPG